MKQGILFKQLYAGSLSYLYKRIANSSSKIRADSKSIHQKFVRLTKIRRFIKKAGLLSYKKKGSYKRINKKRRFTHNKNRRYTRLKNEKSFLRRFYRHRLTNWFVDVTFEDPSTTYKRPFHYVRLTNTLPTYKIAVWRDLDTIFINCVLGNGTKGSIIAVSSREYSGVCFINLGRKHWNRKQFTEFRLWEHSAVDIMLDFISYSVAGGFLNEISLLQFILSKNYIFSKARPNLAVSKKSKFSYNKLGKKLNLHMHKLIFLGYRWHNRWRLWKLKKFLWFIFHSRFKHRGFRKIYKYRPFYNILRGNFKSLTGFSEKELWAVWVALRRQTGGRFYYSSLVSLFSKTILLMPKNLAVFFRLTPSLVSAESFVKSGGFLLNGNICAQLFQVRPGDILQVNILILDRVRLIFKYQHWARMPVNTAMFSFFQIDWSSMMFMLLKWPASYDLIAPSFLNERWVRYYIRNFPVNVQRYKKIKFSWKVER